MRLFSCSCGNLIFFDNFSCVHCGHEIGWCPSCMAMADVQTPDGAAYICAACGANLVKCGNSAHNVCNRFVLAQPDGPVLCDCCQFNRTIPDLSVAGNQAKWAQLEAAKRRCLYGFTMLGLKYGNGVLPALAFEFKGDAAAAHVYSVLASGEQVYTGHDNGVITINIKEADDVEREKLRVEMHEPRRSLLGHFRHEFGHYFWDACIKGRREAECIAVFGDHSVSYADAMKNYYANGPRGDWQAGFVSAYATMHPWEDFAETFGRYLDMTAALDTAYNNGLIAQTNMLDVDWMVVEYQKLGIKLNEMNRSNGLLDYLPEVITQAVVGKLKFVNSMRGG